MRPLVLCFVAAMLGCAGSRFMPKAPPKMRPPAPQCPVRPAANLALPDAPRGSGRVALVELTGDPARAEQLSKQLETSLSNAGYTVERVTAPPPDRARFQWIVGGTAGEPPDRTRLHATAVPQERPRAHVEFRAYPQDLIVLITGPRALAQAMAAHDDPPPPPLEAELVLAQCVIEDHDHPSCPGFRPSGTQLVELTPPPADADRVIWRDGDVEVALAFAEVEATLAAMTQDTWDERRAEWASSRLSHLRRLHRRGEQPWLSSWLVTRQRDARMDSLVHAIVGSGAAEIHVCTGPILEYLVAEPIATARGEELRLLLPDGAPLLP